MSVFESVKRHLEHLNEQIIGQSYLTERLFIALLADGHLLVEGAPGLAKTTAIKALSGGWKVIFIVFNLPLTFYQQI